MVLTWLLLRWALAAALVLVLVGSPVTNFGFLGVVVINLIVNAIVNAGPYSSLYGYDANSNQIYWKDNSSNTPFVFEFLILACKSKT